MQGHVVSGGCPVYYTALRSILAFYPLNVSGTPPPRCDNKQCLQALPNVPWRTKCIPLPTTLLKTTVCKQPHQRCISGDLSLSKVQIVYTLRLCKKEVDRKTPEISFSFSPLVPSLLFSPFALLFFFSNILPSFGEAIREISCS